MPDLNVQKIPTADDKSLPIFAEFDRLADRIRVQAYKLFAHRGAGNGHALDDWLAAEREVCWPSAELTERDADYVLKVALAGFESTDISVTATPSEIMIKAAHKHEKTSGEGEAKVRWSEFRSNDVFRRIELATPLDVDKITATFKNGLLEIVAPKARAATQAPAKIEVASAS